MQIKKFQFVFMASIITILFFGGIEFILTVIGVNATFRSTKPSRLVCEDATFGYRVRKNIDLHAPRLLLNAELSAVEGNQDNGFFSVRTDHNGFRSKYDISREKNGYRIICFGDSTTFGWGEDNENSYPALLKSLFFAENPRIEIVNAGQPGFSSYQAYLYYTGFLSHYATDIIILSFGHNDHDIAIHGYKSAREKILKLTGKMGALRFWFRKSETYLLLDRMMTKVIGKLSAVTTHTKTDFSNPGSVSQFGEHLKLLIHAIRRNGTIPVLLTQPVVIESPTTAAYNRMIRSIAQQNRVILVDPIPLFKTKLSHLADPSKIPDEFFWDNIHLTAKGNSLLAQILYTNTDFHRILPPKYQPERIREE